ncbi:E3 ubiquitin-protein ligase SINA-like 10 [Lolium perenne]|uniref:E3 ubiquitin-protein ligase SINA-like 10 n=1 Tax=Lolium perenne TaxID=4522 RepID=UPI0021F609A4|nr:E3 ubiquitin-protein ligase SINA-like 10 [Lolium perenne]
MTLDEDMLDCGVCFLPLKPPIFQCDAGHVVCSSYRYKLATFGRCHVCSTAITGGYRRCHALEQLVESIRGSCPNATYGCAARVLYYDLHAHLLDCPHAPCHCPREACGFVGSTSALLDHFVGTHKWPCITGVRNSENRAIHLHDGFNFMAVVHDTR